MEYISAFHLPAAFFFSVLKSDAAESNGFINYKKEKN